VGMWIHPRGWWNVDRKVGALSVDDRDHVAEFLILVSLSGRARLQLLQQSCLGRLSARLHSFGGSYMYCITHGCMCLQLLGP